MYGDKVSTLFLPTILLAFFEKIWYYKNKELSIKIDYTQLSDRKKLWVRLYGVYRTTTG
jgi:uncharacterized membrane-anchored protein